MPIPLIRSLTHPTSTTLETSTQKQRSDSVYSTLIQQISSHYRLSPHQLSIEKSPQGKPFVYSILHNRKQRLPHCHISISHANHISVWTLSQSPASIDIEVIQHRRLLHPLLTKLLLSVDFSSPLTLSSSYADLNQQIHDLDQQQRLLCFYKLWTFAESWCKWHDTTLWKTFQHKIPFPWMSLNDLLSCNHTQAPPNLTIAYNLSFDHHIICQIYPS